MRGYQRKIRAMGEGRRLKSGIRILMTLVVIMLGMMLLVGCQSTDPSSEETFASHVKEIQAGTQQSNGRTTTNYQVILKEGIDWEGLDDKVRKEITDEAVLECKSRASAAGTKEYNIIGTKENGETAFLYDRSVEQILIYENGVSTGEIVSAPTN